MTRRLLIIAVILLSGRYAYAQASCSVGMISGLNFGTYDVFTSVPNDSTATLTVECSSLLGTEQVLVQLGKGSSASYAMRTMQNGAFTLQYNVFLDANASIVFGDGTGGSSSYGPVSGSSLVNGQLSLTVYGRVYARQNVRAGAYTDVLMVTVNF